MNLLNFSLYLLFFLVILGNFVREKVGAPPLKSKWGLAIIMAAVHDLAILTPFDLKKENSGKANRFFLSYFFDSLVLMGSNKNLLERFFQTTCFLFFVLNFTKML